MNFEKAHKELLSGKKIRCKEWEPLMHVKLINDKAVTFRGEYSAYYVNAEILISKGWKVIDGDNSELNFVEALEELKLKKSIRKGDWPDGQFLFVDKDQLAICKPVEYDFMPSWKDMIGSSWELIK